MGLRQTLPTRQEPIWVDKVDKEDKVDKVDKVDKEKQTKDVLRVRLRKLPLAPPKREEEENETGDKSEAFCTGSDQYEPVLERDGGVLLAAAGGEDGGLEVRLGGRAS